jgi:hypothetical protein
MRQTNETFTQASIQIPANNEDEIRQRLGFNELLNSSSSTKINKSMHFTKTSLSTSLSIENDNSHKYACRSRSLLPSTRVFFVLAALVNFATVGSAAPMHKTRMQRRSLSVLDLPALEDTILPDTQRHRFATVNSFTLFISVKCLFV